jgi:hypothetical protein
MQLISDEPLNALAWFLKVEPDIITSWSDNSLTVQGHKGEYQLSKRKRKGLMELLGKHDGYWIYRN